MRLPAVTCLVLAAALAAQGEPANPPDTLTVATYNVENLFDNHDNPYKPDEGTSPKSRAEQRVLAATIDRLDADVLALQEVENLGVLNALNRHLAKPYPFVEILPGNDMRGIHCALLSRVEIRRATSHRHWILAGERRFARDLPVYELRPSSGTGLLVAPVHFKSKRTVDKDQQGNQWRTAEAAAAIAVLDELRARGSKLPFILLGDFNDERASAPLAALFGRFKDATTNAPEAERYSYVWSGRKQQIDHIVYDGPLVPKRATFVHEADSASDHCPIVARFAWPEKVVRRPGPRQVAWVAHERPPRFEATDLTGLGRFLLREVEVTGKVHAVRPTRRGGHYNLHFAADPRRALVVFVPRKAVPRFPDIEGMLGKTVTLRGPLFRYRGKLEIQLTRKSQLSAE